MSTLQPQSQSQSQHQPQHQPQSIITTTHPIQSPSTSSHQISSTQTEFEIPPGHVAFHLSPAIQKTVVTTTTFTTLNFPPVLLPRPTTPPTLPESEAHSHRGWSGRARWPVNQYSNLPSSSDLRLDPKIYPLSKAPVPSDWTVRGLSVPLHDGSYARFNPGRPLPSASPSASNSTSTKPISKHKPKQSPSSLDSCRIHTESSRKRLSLSHPGSLSVIAPSSSSALPPRKKVRLNDLEDQVEHQTLMNPEHAGSSTSLSPACPSKSQSSTHPISGLLSPLPTGFDQAVHESIHDPPLDQPIPAHPLQAANAQPALSTITSLPNLISEFAQLPAQLQQYTLFNLLRTSPVPVLQFVQSLVAPALRRDFVSDLPPELAALVLRRLDGQSLCRASCVSRTWHSLIETSPAIWKYRLMAEGLWVGDGSETVEAEECQLIEEGVPRSEAFQFTRLWNDGVWRAPEHARRTRAEDGGSLGRRTASFGGREGGPGPGLRGGRLGLARSPTATMQTDGLVPASPASEPRRREPRTLASNSTWLTRTPRLPTSPYPLSSPLSPPEGQCSHHLGPTVSRSQTAILNKYKLLYRKRHLTRQNWKNKEPRRITFPGHGLNVVTCLQFDWDKLVAASDDEAIHSYELRTGRRLMSFVGHKGGVWALQYVANVLVTGSTDRTVRVWDMATGRNTHVFSGHTSTVRCLQIVEPVNINPDADGPPVWEPAFPLIVTGSRDHTLKVWKLPSTDDEEYLPGPLLGSPSVDEGELAAATATNPFHLFSLRGHTHAVRALAAAGRTVVSGSYDTTVRVWDLMTGECKHEMRGHCQKVYSVVIDRLRARCASGSMDNTVRLWDLKTGTTLAVMEDHNSLVGLLGFSHTKIVSAAADSTLRIWDPSTGAPLAELRGHLGAITCFKHDEGRVVSGSDGTLKLWDASDGTLIRELCSGYSAVWQVSFDERFAVVAVQRGTVSEYEVLDFGRTDGRTDEEDENRMRALTLGQSSRGRTGLGKAWRLTTDAQRAAAVEAVAVEEMDEGAVESWSSSESGEGGGDSGGGVESSSEDSGWGLW
ncbi:hypothetical protein CROQUDRAFT_133898 [Cronartium quercuum f. sp. fusiforme G11]|uniref:F-box domain-containing protein n=1 Tax=Cronartium quercuum f. sp. fusiforme G11 TaxID=708437 RepID=A0A9P6TAG7_9BASI|nr:hypothetical protein CROQUDRAFT_133898 [Cronartium quercuum f. sp. fusiforme G11]